MYILRTLSFVRKITNNNRRHADTPISARNHFAARDYAATPAEFARQVDEPCVQLRVVRFTRSYESARFGESSEAALAPPELYNETLAAAWHR